MVTTWKETADKLRGMGWDVLWKPPHFRAEGDLNFLWRSPHGISGHNFRSADGDSIPDGVIDEAFKLGHIDFKFLRPAT